MAEEKQEANDFETRADEFFSKSAENDTQGAPSDVKETEDGQAKTNETATAEVDKTEQVKEVEADKSLSVEDKIAKIKEIIGEDEKALDAYIKQKGYHNDPAWIKQRELIQNLKKEAEAKAALSEEDRKALEEFKTYRNSAEYIKSSMKAQGYTQEAIDQKLQEAGFQVNAKPEDDVALVINKLGIDVNNMSQEEQMTLKANISDVVKIADILIQDRLGKTLPKELAPIKENLESTAKAENSTKLVNSMQEMTKKEGILDFGKDIEPALNKFLDDNPDATQLDVFEHFKEISRSMTIERLKTGKKQEARDDKKANLRQNLPLSSGKQTTPKKTGNFEADADAFLDTLNI